MKKLFCIVAVILFSLQLSARIAVICDVVYEKSLGEWSDFYRLEVEFLSGGEMGRILESNSLFAVIWFSQTNCAIIKMEHNGILIGEVDKNFVNTYLSFDMLNEGKLGLQVNSKNGEIKWRVYGKDEMSLLIDPMFDAYPYDSYNNNIREQIRKGVVNRRKRPSEERLYAGLDKGVVAFSYGDCYIIGTKVNYIVALRNPIFVFYGTVDKGDIVFGHFRQTGRTDILNGTKKDSGLTVNVVYIANSYKECAEWAMNNVRLDD